MNYFNFKKINITFVLIVISLSTLYGCGYHLRDWTENPQKFMQKLYLSYSGNDFNFIHSLNSTVTSKKAILVKSAKDADIIIQIKFTNKSSRLVSIHSGSLLNKYILCYSVGYNVLNNQNKVILKNQHTSAELNYTTNDTQQLSNENHHQQIYNHLRSQVANDIVRQIQRIT